MYISFFFCVSLGFHFIYVFYHFYIFFFWIALETTFFQFHACCAFLVVCVCIIAAFYSTLRAIIYVRSLGLDKLTNAFGLTALAMGMGVFIGTTTGGILNDFTASYTASFIFAGCCICASGALKLVLPYLIKITKDKKMKN